MNNLKWKILSFTWTYESQKQPVWGQQDLRIGVHVATDLWKAPGGSACPWRALWPSFIVSLKVRVGQKGEKRARAPSRQLRAHWLCARTKGQRHFYLRSALYCTPTIFKSRLMFAGGEHFCTDLHIAIKVKARPWLNTRTWKQPSLSMTPFAQTWATRFAWLQQLFSLSAIFGFLNEMT